MNIFEQYGIKEVADVTLYAIALDKYDNEVYIPVIYFDTLKVSNVELAAEQTAARGGLGNPELIIWDYGKEITVSLLDALFTPASQSLMWGGRFGLGKFKIFGAWNPVIFDRDLKGILDRIEIVDYKTDEGYNFLCYGDELVKSLILEAPRGDLRHLNINGEEWPDGPWERKDEGYYTANSMGKQVTDKDKAPECCELVIENFEDFQATLFLKTYDDNDKEIYKEYNEYRPIINPPLDLLAAHGYEGYIEYQWKNCSIKMVTEIGNMEVYFADNINICCCTSLDSRDDIIYIRDNEGNILFSLSFYKNFNWIASSDDGITEEKHSVPIYVGEFYIVQDRNLTNFNNKDFIYPIEHGINNVYYLDKMEKCTALLDFVIKTDVNATMFQYSLLSKYSQTELVVYINPVTMKPYEANTTSFKRANGQMIYGNFTLIKKDSPYYRWSRSVAKEHTSLGHQIIVDAAHFPGTFRLVGEAYARRRDDHKDERYLFEIPLCKLSSNASLVLEAAGEPTTYDFNLKVLRRSDGVMMKLTLYDVENYHIDDYCSDSKIVVYKEEIPNTGECCPGPQIKKKDEHPAILEIGHKDPSIIGLTIINPPASTVFSLFKDYGNPFNSNGEIPYLVLPESIALAEEIENMVNNNEDANDKYRNVLVVKIEYDGKAKKPSYILSQNMDEFDFSYRIEGDTE